MPLPLDGMKAVDSSSFWVCATPVVSEFHNLFSNHKLPPGLLNYKWSQTGIYDIYDKSIVGVYVSLLFGAGASYWRSGDKLTAVVLAAVGILQGMGAKNGSYSRLLKK